MHTFTSETLFLHSSSIQIYYSLRKKKILLKNELRGYWILAKETGFTSRINVHYYLTVFTKPCCDIWSLVSIYTSMNPHPKLLWSWKKNAMNFAYTLKPTLWPLSISPISVPLWPQKNLIIEMRSLVSLN